MKALVLQIAEKAGISTTERGIGTFLVSSNDVKRFVETCHQEQIVIDGIEGFHPIADGLLADMALIADFSSLSNLPWPERCKLSVQSSLHFFEDVGGNSETLFDFQLRRDIAVEA